MCFRLKLKPVSSGNFCVLLWIRNDTFLAGKFSSPRQDMPINNGDQSLIAACAKLLQLVQRTRCLDACTFMLVLTKKVRRNLSRRHSLNEHTISIARIPLSGQLSVMWTTKTKSPASLFWVEILSQVHRCELPCPIFHIPHSRNAVHNTGGDVEYYNLFVSYLHCCLLRLDSSNHFHGCAPRPKREYFELVEGPTQCQGRGRASSQGRRAIPDNPPCGCGCHHHSS